jgi:hypothetical protein
MGTTLTGTTPQDTYDSLIKVTDNGPLSGTAKYLSDGLGNDSVLALSQAAVGIGTTNPLNPLFVSVSNAGDYAAFVENTNSSNGYGLVARTAHTGASAYAFAARADATDIFVVRADGHVGIGTGAPASTLDVSGTLEVSSTGVFVGDLRTNGNFSVGNTTLAGTKVAQIYPSATSTPAIIQGVHAGVGPYDLALQTSGGNVGIGTSETTQKLTVNGSAAVGGQQAFWLRDDDGFSANAARRAWAITANYSSFGTFSIYGASAVDSDPLAGTNFLEITPTGVLSLNQGQIKFPATQVASADANTLDDYEEGTWTMGVAFGGASVGVTYSQNTGTYTKIGRQVTVNGFLILTNKGSSTGIARLTGLPYVIANTQGNYSAPTFRFDSITFADQYQGYGDINTTTITLEEITSLGVSSNITNADFANSSQILLSFTYFV